MTLRKQHTYTHIADTGLLLKSVCARPHTANGIVGGQIMLVLLGRERGSGDFDFGLCELAVLMALQYTTFYNCRSDSLITVAAIFLAQVQVCLPSERRCNTIILRNRSNCGVGDKQLAHALAHLKFAIQPPAFPSPATFHMCAPADRPVWWSTFTFKKKHSYMQEHGTLSSVDNNAPGAYTVRDVEYSGACRSHSRIYLIGSNKTTQMLSMCG